MSSQLKGKLNRARDKLRTRRTTRTTSRPLVSGARGKRTLEVSRLDEDVLEEEEEMGPADKNPRLQALLTDEILNHILRFASVGDLKRCRLVNKHWNSVATARWKKRGVVLKIDKYSGRSLMNFVHFSRRSGSGGIRSGTTASLLDKISGLSALITDGYLIDYPAAIQSFAAQCQSHLKILKLAMYLNITSYNPAIVSSIKQLLTTYLANLEHIVLDFLDRSSAAILLDPEKLQQLELPNSSTKLKRLEILRYSCDVHQTSLGQGLLAQLLRESHNLENFVFEQAKNAWDQSSPCCCYKMLFNLLNSGTCGGQLSRVKELSLTFLSCHLDICRFCNALVNNGEAALLQHSSLQSLSFSGIPWKEMFITFRHHQHTLRRLTIGAYGLPPFDHYGSGGGGEPELGVILPNLWEFNARVKLSDQFFTTLLTMFPQLGSLGLTNPTAQQLRYVWEHFVQLHTLGLHFVEINHNCIALQCLASTFTAQDPHADNMMHLDSVLSGFSINSCEVMYAKIAADQTDQTILSKSLSEPPHLLARSNTILNLGKLRSLEITRTSRDLYPVRLTEVGLVLILLKLGSLTKLTVQSCTMLLPGTLSLIEHHVSPAMTLAISEQSEFSLNDLGQVKAMWL